MNKKTVPHTHSGRVRLDKAHPLYVEVLRLHHTACEYKQPTYKDPITGAIVFTSDFLSSRGFCCNSGCRHCPYG